MNLDLFLLDLGIDDTADFKPRCIIPNSSPLLFSSVSISVKKIVQKLQKQGWRFYLVDQNRGRCYFTAKVITLPFFILQREADCEGYKDWYISHECAHAFAGSKAKHGPIFMEWLKRICPIESVKYELGYKPRNAAAAGIGSPRRVLGVEDF